MPPESLLPNESQLPKEKPVIPLTVASDEDYNQLPLIHQSQLNRIFTGNLSDIDPLRREEEQTLLSIKPAVIHGNIFDYMVENNTTKVPNFVAFREIPSEGYTQKVLEEEILRTEIDPENEVEVYNIITTLGLWKSENDKKRFARAQLSQERIDYIYQERRLASLEPHNIVTEEQYHKFPKAVQSTLNKLNDHYKTKNEDIHFYTQVVLKNNKYIGKLDLIVVNFTQKTIRAIDTKLKNVGKPENWKMSFHNYGYFIQSFMYSGLILDNIPKDWTFTGFDFLVANLDYPDTPVIFEVFEKTKIKDYYNYNIVTDYGKKLPSINDLALDYEYHMATKNFSASAQLLRNNLVDQIFV